MLAEPAHLPPSCKRSARFCKPYPEKMITQARTRMSRQSGFTLVEILVALLVIAILATVAVASFLGQQTRAHDTAARENLMTAYKSAQSQYAGNKGIYPDITTLVDTLAAKESGLTFHDYGTSLNVSTGPSNISVSRDADKLITMCAKSESQKVYCLRVSEDGQLDTTGGTLHAETEAGAPSFVVAASSALSGLFGEPAYAATESLDDGLGFEGTNERISKCIGLNEIDTRDCLAEPKDYSAPNESAVPGWEEPTDDLEPDPPPSSEWFDEVQADNPVAMCPFDEDNPPGKDPIDLECLGVSGIFGSGVDFQEAGALLNWPANKSVYLDGTQNITGTPTPSATNNRSNHWSLEVWAKPQNSGQNQVIISADSNWAMRTTATGFACDQQSKPSNPIQTVTGGPAPMSNTWYHIVCTEDKDTLKLYINGVLVGTDVTHQTGVSKTGKVKIGSVTSGWSGGGKFVGWIDQWSFYKKTLSPERILAHYSASGR